MDLSVQHNIVSQDKSVEGSLLLEDGQKKSDPSLCVEIVLVMIVAIGAIKIFETGTPLVPAWLMTPGILIVAALLPAAIRKEGFQQLGFNVEYLRDSLAVLGWTCLALFPLTFCGLWILKSCGFGFFIWPVNPGGSSWISWILYQFMYIALAEEVFFRGYVQSNILRLTRPIMGRWPRRWQWMSISLSAVCFAVAHIIIQGHIGSALTFLPGLVLGWLFIRTRSLWAPILFHGLANAFYLAMSVVFA